MKTRYCCRFWFVFSVALSQVHIHSYGQGIEESVRADKEGLEQGRGVQVQDQDLDPSGSAADVLRFLNGDQLHGELNLIGRNGLIWQHGHVEEPMRFGRDIVKDVELNGPFPDANFRMLTRVSLTNGDDYRGTVVEMDKERLVLETPYGGELELAAEMIRELSLSTEQARILYQGPTGRDDFVISESVNWTSKNNALYFSGSEPGEVLGLPFHEFPDLASVEFDLEWKGDSMGLLFFFWADQPKDQGERHLLMFQRDFVRFARRTKSLEEQNYGIVSLQSVQRVGKKYSVQLFLNRTKREVYLFLNGEEVKKFTSIEDEAVTGGALSFRVTSGSGPIKLSHLLVRESEGKFEAAGKKDAVTEDLVLLSNGDSLSGQVLSIQKNVLRIQTDSAELPISISRVSTIRFAQDTRTEPRQRATDVHIFFQNDERITLDLEQWEKRTLRGRSETAGGITLDTRYVSKVSFYPYDDPTVTEHDDW